MKIKLHISSFYVLNLLVAADTIVTLLKPIILCFILISSLLAMPTICRCGLVAKLLLTRPSVSSVSVRFKYNQPFEAPEWKDIALRENAYGRETFITRTDKERFDYYNEVY